MKLKKKNIIHIAVLIGVYALLVLAMTRFKYAFGSKMDWGGQHYAIPDYFRKLFYETGEFFPSFAPNIGAGENIYNLSYYGLFSPIILFSYLLPFVKMSTYIQVVSVLGVMVSTFIFYRWMCSKFKENTALYLSIVFMFSSAVIFHAHRHIMFTSYMPFLLMSFISVEEYLNGKKRYKLVVFTFLTIMTNYFFAVSGVFSIVIYGIYWYLKINTDFKLKEFLKCGFAFAGRILTAVLMSGILLIPTMYCLMSGRDPSSNKFDWSIFLPQLNPKYSLFYHYSIGLSLFVICAVISALLCKDKARKFLGFVFTLLLTFPCFVYILNGTLYTDPKVLITFVPMAIILVGEAYNEVRNGSFKYKVIVPVTVIYAVCSLIFCDLYTGLIAAIIADLIVLPCTLIYYKIKGNVRVLNVGLVVVMIVANLICSFNDNFVLLDDLKKDNSPEINELAKYPLEDNDIYRTANNVDNEKTVNLIYNHGYYTSHIYSSLHNKLYSDFYFNEMYNENEYRNKALETQSKNLLFNIYMSEKYLISDDESVVPSGYKKVKEKGNLALYENDRVMPFGYASSSLMSTEDYNKLEYPYSVDALMNYTIVDGVESSEYQSNIKTVSPFKINDSDGIKNNDGKVSIKSDTDIVKTVKLDQPIKDDEVMMLRFNVDNKLSGRKCDARVTVNGIKNTLTTRSWKYYNDNKIFEYVITSGNKKQIDQLSLKFGSGEYDIRNIECYIVKYPDNANNVDAFHINKAETKGDTIVGSVDAEEDGYFSITIPYTDGFSINVNGEDVKCEKVNTAFIGCKLSKGHNEIKITFKAPFKTEGIIVSATGILIFMLMILFDFKKKKSATN